MHALGLLRSNKNKRVDLCEPSDSDGSDPSDELDADEQVEDEQDHLVGRSGSTNFEDEEDLEAADAQQKLLPYTHTVCWCFPLTCYNTFTRVRTAYAVATACVALVSVSLGVSLQVFFSVFSMPEGQGNLLKGFGVIFFTPLLFLAAATLADEMLELCLDALDNPPLSSCRALFITVGMPRGCIDHFIIILSELFPIAVAAKICADTGQFQLSKVSAAYVEGSQLSVLILAATQLAVHARVICAGKADEAQDIAHALDVREVLVGQTGAYLGLDWRHLEPHEKGAKSNKLVRGQTIEGRRERMQPRIAGGVFCAALVVLLLLAVLAQFHLIRIHVALVGMAISLILMSRATAYMFPGLVGAAFNVLIGLFIVIAIGLLVFSRSDVLNVDLRSKSIPNVFEPPPPGNGNYTPIADPYGKYPICSMRWGRRDLPDQLQLSVMDMAVFADAVYYSYGEEVMQVVNNATDGTDLEGVNLEELEDRATVGRWGVFELPRSKVRVLAIRGTTSTEDTMADADMYAAIQVMQFFNQFLPVLSLYPTSFTRSLLGHFAIHKWLGEKAMWRDVVAKAVQLKRRGSWDGHDLVITGHSLGGSLASIAGAFAEIPAVAFSPPGQAYSSERFGIEDQVHLEKSGTVIKPRYDLVPEVDLQVGFTQVIECPVETPLLCHSIGRTACELFRSCGDPRGRTMRENCALNG